MKVTGTHAIYSFHEKESMKCKDIKDIYPTSPVRKHETPSQQRMKRTK